LEYEQSLRLSAEWSSAMVLMARPDYCAGDANQRFVKPKQILRQKTALKSSEQGEETRKLACALLNKI